MEPYRPNEPFIKMKLNGSLLDRMVEAGIPLTRALQYFRDNPEGSALETLKLAAEDVVPFYGNYRNNGDLSDYAKEAIMLGMPVPGPKGTRTVNTPGGRIDLHLNSRIPDLDAVRNAEFNRLNDLRNDVDWRGRDNFSDSWFGDDWNKEFGDELSPEGYSINKDRYETNSNHPDDFNNMIDEYYAEDPGTFEEYYGDPNDIKFEQGTSEYNEAEANAKALDKLYSEMNNDNALITNEEGIRRNRESKLINEYWDDKEAIYHKYKKPEYRRGYVDLNKTVTPEDFTRSYRKQLTPEERIELVERINAMETELANKPWLTGILGNNLTKARTTLERGYQELPKPEAVEAFPDYDSYKKYKDEMTEFLANRNFPSDYKLNETDIKPATDVYDYVMNDPNLMTREVWGGHRNPIYTKLLDNEYKYVPESEFPVPSSEYVYKSLNDYNEPFRMTVNDFDEIAKALDAQRLNDSKYNETWSNDLKNQVDLLENDLISNEDKTLMKREIDNAAEELKREADPARRNHILRTLQSNLDAIGLNWAR